MLRIAVWHHALGDLDDLGFLSHLRQAGVRLVLHGDVHDVRAEVTDYLHPESCVYSIGAGSFGASANQLAYATPRLYNLLEIQPDRKTVRVYVRQQSTLDSAWEGLHEWRDSGFAGKVPYFDIPIA